jgi:hypothetical protein
MSSEAGNSHAIAAELLQPMLSKMVATPGTTDLSRMSRPRYLCTQCTSLAVAFLLVGGLCIYAIIKTEDLREFLLAGCKMFHNVTCNTTELYKV